LTLFSIGGLYASDGTLDPSFGAGLGFVQTPVGISALKVAIQTDGKIVVIGTASLNDQLVRYNTNGTLDGTFGIGGIVAAPANGDFNNVIIQPDGKIIIVGTDSTSSSFFMVRYNTNGTLDATFGVGGMVTGPTGFANDIMLQPDSKIVVAGSDLIGNFQVVRYDASGTIDTIFVTGPSGFASAVVIEPSDKIIVAGTSNSDLLQVVRYNADGTLDSTFGSGGIALGPNGALGNVLLQPDGKIVVGSYNRVSIPFRFQAVRFTSSGSLDATFGVGGIALGPNGTANDALLQADGKIVLVGFNSVSSMFQLARFTTGGILDVSFGVGGVTTGPTGLAVGTASQADGKIIAVGSAPGFGHFQVARYIGGPALVDTQIVSPVNGAQLRVGKSIQFRGTAQNPSMVYLFLNGVLVKGVATDPFTNTWSMSLIIGTKGVYTAEVVSIYEDGNVDIMSLPITLRVGLTSICSGICS
jgi:uncharacterized delta-60 repeat protein